MKDMELEGDSWAECLMMDAWLLEMKQILAFWMDIGASTAI